MEDSAGGSFDETRTDKGNYRQLCRTASSLNELQRGRMALRIHIRSYPIWHLQK